MRRPFERDREPLIVFYDGHCGICSGVRETLARIDLLGHIRWIPLQTPGAVELVGLTLDQAMDTVWAIDARGRLLSGVEVVAAVLDALLPTGGTLTRAVSLRALRTLLEPLFHFVSENRRKVVACPIVHPRLEELSAEDAALLRARGALADHRRRTERLHRGGTGRPRLRPVSA